MRTTVTVPNKARKEESEDEASTSGAQEQRHSLESRAASESSPLVEGDGGAASSMDRTLTPERETKRSGKGVKPKPAPRARASGVGRLSDDAEAASSASTSKGVTHGGQQHETAAAVSEAERVLMEAATKRRTKSSKSRGAGSHDTLSGGDAEADDDESDDSLTGSTAVDMVKLYDDTVEGLEVQQKQEEDLMEALTQYMEAMNVVSAEIRRFALEVFGEAIQFATGSEEPGSPPRARRASERLAAKGGQARGPNVKFQRRLDEVRAYVASASEELEETPEARAEAEGAGAVSELEGACSLPPTPKQKGKSSSGGAGAACSAAAAPVAGGRGEGSGRAAAEGEQSYGGGRRRGPAPRKSWEDDVIGKMCSVIEQRILKARASSRIVLKNMKCVSHVVSSAMDSYRVTELVIQKAKSCKADTACDTLRTIVAAAVETSTWMWKALGYAEAAVARHKAIVETIEQAERSLYGVDLGHGVDNRVVRDMAAAVDDVEALTAQINFLHMDDPQDSEEVAQLVSVSPTIPFEAGKGAGKRGPADVLKTLLAATKCSMIAVTATSRAVATFKLCDECVGRGDSKHDGSDKKTKKKTKKTKK